jgi:uncharacterized protein (DUF1015 family)
MHPMDVPEAPATAHVANPLRLHPFRGVTLAPSRLGVPGVTRLLARPYREVGERLAAWQQAGWLIHDGEPALYLHEYTTNGITLRGLVGALDLATRATGLADRGVFPHEAAHREQVAEMSGRMAEIGVNPAPILLVQHHPPKLRALLGQVRHDVPDRFVDRHGVQHQVWRITTLAAVETIDEELAGAKVVIADGHHRYGAYLDLQRTYPGTPWDRGLAMIVDQGDTPLFVGAIHRVLHGVRIEDLRTAAVAIGLEVIGQPQAIAVGALGPNVLALFDGHGWATLTIEVPAGDTAVGILHTRILPLLTAPPVRITHHHTAADALNKPKPGQPGLAVLLPAIDFEHIRQAVTRDHVLPEKATSFQPKPGLGVLMRWLPDEGALPH